MVKRLKLNEKALRDADPKPGVSYQVFDTEVIGFAVRVQASGARTFTIDYRHAGRQRRMNIGRWPEWSVTAARERAKELRRAHRRGARPFGRAGGFPRGPAHQGHDRPLHPGTSAEAGEEQRRGPDLDA